MGGKETKPSQDNISHVTSTEPRRVYPRKIDSNKFETMIKLFKATIGMAAVIGLGILTEKLQEDRRLKTIYPEIVFGTGRVGPAADIFIHNPTGECVNRSAISIPRIDTNTGKLYFRNPLVAIHDGQIYLEFQGKLSGQKNNFYAHIDGINAALLSINNVGDIENTITVGNNTIFTYKGNGGNIGQINKMYTSVAYNLKTNTSK